MRPHRFQVTDAKPLALPQIVVFPAEADITNSTAVLESLLAAFRPRVWVVIADLTATEFCDSSGMRALIIAHNQATCTGAELRVVLSSPAVRRAMQVLGADQMLRLYPDMSSALTGAPQVGVQPDDAAPSAGGASLTGHAPKAYALPSSTATSLQSQM